MLELPSVELIVMKPELIEKGWLPKRQTDGSCGYDVRACIEKPITFYPGEKKRLGLGFKMHINDPRWTAFVVIRSSIGNSGLVVANQIGVIDSDYQGEWLLPLHYRGYDEAPMFSPQPITIEPGMRLAQIVFLPVGLPELKLVDAFSTQTVRGAGGLGSTGTA